MRMHICCWEGVQPTLNASHCSPWLQSLVVVGYEGHQLIVLSWREGGRGGTASHFPARHTTAAHRA